jgi:hypothetical protein
MAAEQRYVTWGCGLGVREIRTKEPNCAPGSRHDTHGALVVVSKSILKGADEESDACRL